MADPAFGKVVDLKEGNFFKKAWTKATSAIVRSLNYYVVHMLYILLLIFVGAIIIFLIENYSSATNVWGNRIPMPFVDALFQATSAVCVTGLISVDFSRTTVASQIVICVLIQLGSSVLMTLPVLIARRQAFRKAFEKRLRRTGASSSSSSSSPSDECSAAIEGPDLSECLEYQAMGKLIKVVPIYVFLTEMVAFGLFCIALYSSQDSIDILAQRKINPVWWAFFHSISAFNNAGFGLCEENMIPFAQDRPILLILSVLIVMGNIAFPIFLRMICSLCHRFSRGDNRVTWRYLLDHPRQCFTHLFPYQHTRYLALVFCLMLATQLTIFISLEYNKAMANAEYDLADKFLIGYFQSTATRTAGFNVTDVSRFVPGVLVMDIVFMYISAYPFFITNTASSRPIPAIGGGIILDLDDGEEQEMDFIDPLTQQNTVQNKKVQDHLESDNKASLLRSPSKARILLDTVRRSFDLNSFPVEDPSSPTARRRRVGVSHHESSLSRENSFSVPSSSMSAAFHKSPSSSRLAPLSLSRSSSIRSLSSSSSVDHVAISVVPSSPAGGSRLITSLDSGMHRPDIHALNKLHDKMEAGRGKHIIKDNMQQLVLRDVSWILLAIFAISVIDENLLANDSGASLFKLLYEVVSSYGTVGLTMGYPNSPVAFSGVLAPASKFFIMIVMILGRHRGLPNSLDPAVLPSKYSERKEARVILSRSSIDGERSSQLVSDSADAPMSANDYQHEEAEPASRHPSRTVFDDSSRKGSGSIFGGGKVSLLYSGRSSHVHQGDIELHDVLISSSSATSSPSENSSVSATPESLTPVALSSENALIEEHSAVSSSSALSAAVSASDSNSMNHIDLMSAEHDLFLDLPAHEAHEESIVAPQSEAEGNAKSSSAISSSSSSFSSLPA